MKIVLCSITMANEVIINVRSCQSLLNLKLDLYDKNTRNKQTTTSNKGDCVKL